MSTKSHKTVNNFTQFPFNIEWLNAFARAYQLRPTAIQPISSGNENSSFLVVTANRRYVLRVYRLNRKPLAMIEQEARLSSYLEQAGLPVPSLITNITGESVTTLPFAGREWHAILMPFMPGVAADKYSPKLLAQIARLHARSHILGIHYADICRAKSRNPLRRLARALLRHGFSHYDWFGPNVLTHKDEVTAVIDFDDAHYGIVVRCLIRTLDLLYQATGSWRDILHYLRAYQQVRQLTLPEKIVCVLYLLLRYHYAWTFRLVLSSLLTKARIHRVSGSRGLAEA